MRSVPAVVAVELASRESVKASDAPLVANGKEAELQEAKRTPLVAMPLAVAARHGEVQGPVPTTQGLLEAGTPEVTAQLRSEKVPVGLDERRSQPSTAPESPRLPRAEPEISLHRRFSTATVPGPLDWLRDLDSAAKHEQTPVPNSKQTMIGWLDLEHQVQLPTVMARWALAAAQRQEGVRVRVRPEGYGEVIVSVVRRDAGIHVRVEATHAQVQAMLQQASSEIVQALHASGVDVTEFQVGLLAQDGSFSGDVGAQPQGMSAGQHDSPPRRSPGEGMKSARAPMTRMVRVDAWRRHTFDTWV